MVALLFALPLAACSARSPNGDCGLTGIAPHPEIGGELVYTCFDPVNKSEMFLLDVTTGRVRPLTADHAWTTDPAWSPDGARIAFVGTRIFPELASPKFGPPARQDVFAVRPDGTDLRRLTGPHGDGYAFGASGQSPTWWPDGSRLFFDSQRQVNEGPTTYVMNADGSCEGRFGQAPIRLQRPVWRPGSQPGLGPIMCSDLRVMALPSGGYVGPAALGQASPFRFEIDNDGSETATGVRVELKSTANVELLDGNGGTFPCTGPRLDLVCALPLLAPARGLSVSFLVRSPVASTAARSATSRSSIGSTW